MAMDCTYFLLTVVVFGEAGFEAEAGVTILHFCARLL